eukprot:3706196-Pyramimonas_sp.AAC.1
MHTDHMSGGSGCTAHLRGRVVSAGSRSQSHQGRGYLRGRAGEAIDNPSMADAVLLLDALLDEEHHELVRYVLACVQVLLRLDAHLRRVLVRRVAEELEKQEPITSGEGVSTGSRSQSHQGRG